MGRKKNTKERLSGAQISLSPLHKQDLFKNLKMKMRAPVGQHSERAASHLIAPPKSVTERLDVTLTLPQGGLCVISYVCVDWHHGIPGVSPLI